MTTLTPAPDGFTKGEIAQKAHATTGQSEQLHTIRQAAYDLRKIRGKRLLDKPARIRRYHVHPDAARTIAGIITVCDQVIAPILAGVHGP